MTKPVTIEGDGITIAIHPLTVGERIDRADMWERFAPEVPENASARDKEMRAHKSNFIYVGAQSSSAGLQMPTCGDTQEAFDAKFAAFSQLTNAFYQDWITAVAEIDLPKTAKHTLPPETLSEAEKADPE